MMKKTLAFSLLPIALSACVPARQVGMDPAEVCRDQTVNVIYRPGELSVQPNYIEVCHGYTLTLNLRPGRDIDTADTIPQDPMQTWLRRSNATRNAIVIEITEDVPNGLHKYAVSVEGIGQVDPYVQIIY